MLVVGTDVHTDIEKTLRFRTKSYIISRYCTRRFILIRPSAWNRTVFRFYRLREIPSSGRESRRRDVPVFLDEETRKIVVRQLPTKLDNCSTLRQIFCRSIRRKYLTPIPESGFNDFLFEIIFKRRSRWWRLIDDVESLTVNAFPVESQTDSATFSASGSDDKIGISNSATPPACSIRFRVTSPHIVRVLKTTSNQCSTLFIFVFITTWPRLTNAGAGAMCKPRCFTVVARVWWLVRWAHIIDAYDSIFKKYRFY